MNEQQIKELFSDEAFVSSIMEMENPEDVQKALSAKGLELSLAEIKAIQEALSSNEGELSEDELEDVAGGFIGLMIYSIVAASVTVGRPAYKLGKAVSGWTRRRW